ncbi:MAG: nucleotidyltransferase domain-containing protein [bacterium]|nr:nucleotidyltransferase domain-containing protein [bacterium]
MEKEPFLKSKKKPDKIAPKRFSLNKEEFALKRITALKETVQEMKKRYPEIISFGLFGSMSRGQMTETSDIDGYLFVDAEQVQNAENELYGKNAQSVVEYHRDASGEDVVKSVYTYPHFRDEIDEGYQRSLQNTLHQRIPDFSEEQIKHVRVLPLSNEVIDTLVDDLINSHEGWREYNERLQTVYPQGASEKEILASKDNLNMPQTYFDISLLLRSIFHVDVGGGLKLYRAYLIEKLEKAGPVGRHIWKRIIEDVERWEQKLGSKGKLPTEVRYPRTLVEAKDVYGFKV